MSLYAYNIEYMYLYDLILYKKSFRNEFVNLMGWEIHEYFDKYFIFDLLNQN